MQILKRWLAGAGLTLAAAFGTVSLSQAAVVVSFDPAFGSAIPNLGFKGTATLDVGSFCYSLGGGLQYLGESGCTITIQSAHIDFYNINGGPESVFYSQDLTGPFPGNTLSVYEAFFDLDTNELAGISAQISEPFSVSLHDSEVPTETSVDFDGSLGLYFQALAVTPSAFGGMAANAVTTTGTGGARLAICEPTYAASGLCLPTAVSNLASSTFTNFGTVPEPGSLVLVGAALAGLALVRRRRAAR